MVLIPTIRDPRPQSKIELRKPRYGNNIQFYVAAGSFLILCPRTQSGRAYIQDRNLLVTVGIAVAISYEDNRPSIRRRHFAVRDLQLSYLRKGKPLATRRCVHFRTARYLARKFMLIAYHAWELYVVYG